MFARVWWKEARQAWPAWGFLAVVGLAVQSYLFSFWNAEASPSWYSHAALVATMIYLFLIAAAVFAGEREAGTLWILDAMPAERLRVWSAKASFALATTLALGILLWLSALAFGRDPSQWRTAAVTTLVWGLTALGWGLLWSAILSNALHAAVLAMVSICLTLLFLVNLQHWPTTEGTPVLLALAALTTGTSAWVFRAGGPPKREPRRSRPAVPATLATVPNPAEAATIRRTGRIWAVAVPRLLWETLRQVRAELWVLVALAIASAVAPYLIVWNNRYRNEAAPFTLLGTAVLALVTGVLAFNGENRGRTQRFLVHHGARPGVVWAVKVATWWAAALALWAMAFVPVWLTLPPLSHRGVPPGTGYGTLISWVVWGLTIPFAIAVVCGMAFRRGIMAGMIAVVATLAVVIPMWALLGAQVMFPWHWPYVAVAFLGVSWAWSGDWLHDAPGWTRWAQLALYAAAAPAVLAPLYIAGRVWAVPGLPPGQAEAFFQRSRVVAPLPENDNAAPLYTEAFRLISRNAYPTPPDARAELPPAWATDARFLDQDSFTRPRPWLTAWLEQLEPALAKLREGARRPACRYMDLRAATEFDVTDEPWLQRLILPLVVSARVRLVRGDLDGAWVEVETLVRLARQYSYTSQWSAMLVDPVADALVLRWAADPRQTVATLEKASRAWKAIPPGASPADRIRVDAALFHNMLDLPRPALIDKLLYGRSDRKRKVSAIEVLQDNVQTTPWEVARTRRAFDLLAAAQIQRFENTGYPFVAAPQGMPVEQWRSYNGMVDRNWGFLVREDGWTVSLSPDDLNAVASTTPLLEYTSMGRNPMLLSRGQTIERAIWLVLLLRLYQARHDGKLPESLDALLARPGVDSDLAAMPENFVDPYSGKRFGYAASHGQMLLPIGATDPLSWANSFRPDPRLKPAEGCWLLYSVGPDGVDDRAEQTVGFDQKGDFVFPVKDNVKPPGTEPR